MKYTQLLGLAICVLTVTACAEKSEEERRQETNSRLAPEAELTADRSVIVRWPALTSSSGEQVAKEVTLKVPAQYAPAPQREWPYSAKPRIESLLIEVVLSNIKPWAESPPIDPEVYDGPRLYSAINVLFGQKPDSMDNPKTRAEFETWRERSRTHKIVRIKRNISFGTSEQRRHAVNFLRRLYDSPSEVDREGYLRDGEVGGLRRFSKVYCQSVHDPSTSHGKRNPEHKQADDPSPPGCSANRDLALFVAPFEATEWVFIECHPLGVCTARFQAGSRGVEVDMWFHDVVRWRETVGPIRELIDGFVIHGLEQSR